MNFCVINGKPYDVNVTAIEETFTKLYTENTKRTLSNGYMFLDPIGTFISHVVEFAPLENPEDYYELWDFFKYPHSEGFPVEIADGKSTISYEAYTSTGARKLKYIRNDTPYWEGMSINLIPVRAQVLP